MLFAFKVYKNPSSFIFYGLRFSIVNGLSTVKKYWLYKKTSSYIGSLETNEEIFCHTLKEDTSSFLHGLRNCNKKKTWLGNFNATVSYLY